MNKVWERAAGWEYDSLRSLGDEERCRILLAAMRKSIRTWWAWIVYMAVLTPLALSFGYLRAIALAAGAGQVGEFALMHLVAALYLRAAFAHFPVLLRPFVRRELMNTLAHAPSEECPNEFTR